MRESRVISPSEGPVVVLAHGAWADGSSWRRVIPQLQSRGLNVFAAPLPLTSLSDDVEALQRTIERTEGPVVLVAHAYAGAVISFYGDPRVRALVFVTAFAPDQGETVAELFYREAPHPEAPKMQPDKYGLIWMPREGFSAAFAPNASLEENGILAATQRPLSAKCIQEPMGTPAWRTTSCWFLVAEDDRMINVKTQRFMAERMNATIHSHLVDHAPLITAPDRVSSIILEAVDSTTHVVT